mmetsp:Transcript_8389/g.7417  ORF Transcript_8389/g.7417 Transcript_8389/m.7417 type:complete len:231 (-) Transcript_8389:34-726(-)
MKIITAFLLAVILSTYLVSSHYHHNFGEHQALQSRYNGQRPVRSSPYRNHNTRGGVKAALQERTYPGTVARTSKIPTSSVYFAQEEDISEAQLKDLCHQLDTYSNDPHAVSKEEFSEFIRSFGVDFDDAKIVKIYKKLNNARSAGFDLDRFCEKKFSATKKQSEREQLDDIFKKIDKDGSGKIARKEIRSEMKRRNIFNEEYLDQLLDDADKNDDGKVSFKDFLDIAEIV